MLPEFAEIVLATGQLLSGSPQPDDDTEPAAPAAMYLWWRQPFRGTAFTLLSLRELSKKKQVVCSDHAFQHLEQSATAYPHN